MSPVWMIEGAEHESPLATLEREATAMDGESAPARATDRRLSALAQAVREHESANRRHAMPARPQDLELYRRLRRICSEIQHS